jgi:hypothetical protein
MQRLYGGDRRDTPAVAPGEKIRDRAVVGAAYVLVADVIDEEFEETRLRPRAGGGD